MTSQGSSREQRLVTALEPLTKGCSVSGEPLNLALIAAETGAKAREYDSSIAKGQAKTARKSRVRRFQG